MNNREQVIQVIIDDNKRSGVYMFMRLVMNMLATEAKRS